MTHHEERARAYYDCLDTHDYDRLADLLAPAFVHDRPDKTIEGRDRFVQFMREKRPMTDTSHPIDAVYRTDDTDEGTLAVRGRLLDADGKRIVSFVDVFTFEGDAVSRLETYTHP